MNDTILAIIITSALLVVIIPLVWFLSSERFYQKDINRWKPGINLPVLKVPFGTEIDFKKFQKDIRIQFIILFGGFMIATFVLFAAYSLKWESENELGPFFWGYMVFTVLWTAAIIIHTVVWFPKRADKYTRTRIDK